MIQVNVMGQTILRSSINCLGNSSQNENILFRQSVGQPSNTTTFANGITLRQGFQQPINLSVNIFQTEKINISLYPNPATIQTTLIIESTEVGYTVRISALTGTTIQEFITNSAQSKINCTDLTAGIYIISVLKDNILYAATKLIITK